MIHIFFKGEGVEKKKRIFKGEKIILRILSTGISNPAFALRMEIQSIRTYAVSGVPIVVAVSSERPSPPCALPVGRRPQAHPAGPRSPGSSGGARTCPRSQTRTDRPFSSSPRESRHAHL